MIIECSNCQTKYQYDEGRFEGKPSKKIRCAKCKGIFEIRSPSFAAPAPAAHAAPSTGVSFDETQTRSIDPDVATETSPPETPSGQPAERTDAPMRLPEGMRLSVAIIDGVDSGKVYRIEKPRVVIGRSGSDIPLEDSEVSRQHAVIEVYEGMVLLEDLGSTNGTFLDNERIGEPYELWNHAEFVIGSTTLMLIITQDQS
ncbi:MAG TPA: FHA domain-containing protein [Thermoanaerobaculia bacterium]|nr:FHA domain-containing protein [Thermoanaerobaculia bacterium]